MSRRIKTITKTYDVQEIFCDSCGKLTGSVFDYEVPADIDVGTLSVRVNINGSINSIDIDEICTKCALLYGNKIFSNIKEVVASAKK